MCIRDSAYSVQMEMTIAGRNNLLALTSYEWLRKICRNMPTPVSYTHLSKWLPKFYKTIDAEFGGNYAKYVDYLWEKSLIMKKGAKLYFNKKGYEKDPGVSFGMDLNDVFADFAAQDVYKRQA